MSSLTADRGGSRGAARSGTLMALGSMSCVQLGIAASVGLSNRIGPEGVAWLRLAWAGVVLLIVVRPWRVRFACAVPVFIGVRTLILLGDARENRAGIKVSRKEVQRLMVWAAGTALFRSLEPLAYRTIFQR